jgi:hypothetical protein
MVLERKKTSNRQCLCDEIGKNCPCAVSVFVWDYRICVLVVYWVEITSVRTYRIDHRADSMQVVITNSDEFDTCTCIDQMC